MTVRDWSYCLLQTVFGLLDWIASSAVISELLSSPVLLAYLLICFVCSLWSISN